jgi:hypothetical protein
MRLWLFAPSSLLLLLLFSGCAEPPHKEMDQAQAAIDAAQAAGADRYATSAYSAATEALENTRTAATASDHRLALSYALESREHAQNAGRNAADEKVRVRIDVEHASTILTALIAEGHSLLDATAHGAASRTRLEQPAWDLTAAEAHLQEAGEAEETGDYLGASAALEEARIQIEQATTSIRDALPLPPSGR